MKLYFNPTSGGEKATTAFVSYSDRQGFGSVAQQEDRDMPIYAPRGISYRPSEGDQLLLIPVEGANMCAGVRTNSAGLSGGELRLVSAGGASIYLKNNGSVLINGVEITKTGAVIAP